MNKLALFFDIDGTIASYTTPISKKLKEKILEYKQLGHAIFICTGRAYSDIPSDIMRIDFDGYICSTGAYICTKKLVVYSKPLPSDAVTTIYKYLSDSHISAYYETAAQIFRAPFSFPLSNSLPLLDPAYIPKNIYSIAYHLDYKQSLTPLFPTLQSLGVHAIPQTDNSGDIISIHCNKSSGMRQILAFLNLESYTTVAFGDSPNDIDMLMAADYGIAMGHAPDSLKAVADYVTARFEEDGVFLALNQLHSLLTFS